MEGRLLKQSSIFRYITRNKYPFIGLFLLFVTGVLIGSYGLFQSISYQLTLTMPDNSIAIWSLKQTIVLLIENSWFFIVVYFASLSIIGVPIIYLAFVFSGMRVGYTVAVCLSTFELKGLGLAMLSLLMDHLLFLPLSLLFGLYALHIHKCFFNRHSSQSALELPRTLTRYHRHILILGIVLIVMTLIEYSYFMYIFSYFVTFFL